MSMTDSEFEANLRLIRQGEREGLRAVYEAYLPAVYSSVLGILHNQQSAEDIASEFFIKLWNIADRYRPGSGHKAWLMTIARNMAMDHLRRYRREQLMDEMPEQRSEPLKSQEDIICDELTLRETLDTLEEDERQIVNLKIMGELTFKEISRILKKPQGTVAWKYRVALNKLKRCRYE